MYNRERIKSITAVNQINTKLALVNECNWDQTIRKISRTFFKKLHSAEISQTETQRESRQKEPTKTPLPLPKISTENFKSSTKTNIVKGKSHWSPIHPWISKIHYFGKTHKKLRTKLSIDQWKPKHFLCPVGWGCRIHRLLLCRGVRPLPTSVLGMTLNNLIVTFQQCWSFGECGVPLHCHRSQVHSGPEW